MKKKVLMVLVLLMLGVSGCGTTSQTPENYMQGNVTNTQESIEGNNSTEAGIEIIDFDESPEQTMLTEYESLESITASGIIYYEGNPSEYNKSSECSIDFGEVTTTVEGDNKIVTIPVKLCMKAEYTADCIDYSGCITPALDLCDSISGVLISGETVEGQEGYTLSGQIMGQITGEGNSIAVTVQCDSEYTEDNWRPDGDGYIKDMEFNILYTVTVPVDYDGLALKVTPVYNYNEFENMSELIGTHIYDYLPEGSSIFKM